MSNEIIIGLGGLILSSLTYFAGVYRTEKRLNKEEKRQRIEAVFNRYMEFRAGNITGGVDGLLKSGAGTLNDSAEIRELGDMIISHGEKPPLGKNGELDGVDLKVFFEYAAKNRINFLRTPIEDVVRDSSA